MIQISNLTKSYGKQVLYSDVTLSIGPREKLALLGVTAAASQLSSASSWGRAARQRHHRHTKRVQNRNAGAAHQIYPENGAGRGGYRPFGRRNIRPLESGKNTVRPGFH